MDHFFQIRGVGRPEEPMLEGWTTLGLHGGAHDPGAPRPDGRRRPLPSCPACGRRPPRPSTCSPAGGPGWASAPPGTRTSRAGLGFPFPPLGERFEMLEDTLRLVHEMWQGERGLRGRVRGPALRGRPPAQLPPGDHASPPADHDRRRRRAQDAAPRRPVRGRLQRVRRRRRRSTTSTRCSASTARPIGPRPGRDRALHAPDGPAGRSAAAGRERQPRWSTASASCRTRAPST